MPGLFEDGSPIRTPSPSKIGGEKGDDLFKKD